MKHNITASWAGLFLDRARVPVARFFAAGHSEFAASMPGGHTDIFREKKMLISFFSFFLPLFFPCLNSFFMSYLFPCFSLFFPHFDLEKLNHTKGGKLALNIRAR